MRKLTSEQQTEICRFIGEYKTDREILELLKERHHVILSTSAISNYRTHPTWKLIVDKLRRTYLSGLMDVAISQKRHRLQKIDDHLRALENSSDKRIQLQGRELSGEILATLNLARLEMEPSKHDTYNISLMNQFNSLTDEELEQRQVQIMEKVLKLKKVMEGTKDAIHVRETEEVHGSGVSETQIREEDSNGNVGATTP